MRNSRGDSNWVPPEMIEKIEVLRGPAAARYGSGAMGGVVNIRTKGVSNEFRGSVGLFYDQHASGTQQGNTRRANFLLSGPIVQDKLGFRIYGSLNKTNPDAFDINDSVKSSRTALSAGREGVRNRDIAGRLTWNITPEQPSGLRRRIQPSEQHLQRRHPKQQCTHCRRPARRPPSFWAAKTAKIYRQS